MFKELFEALRKKNTLGEMISQFVEMLESNRQSPLATTEHLYLALPRGATDETDLFA